MSQAHGHPRGEAYDSFVNWDARLARELPLFRELFETAGVSRVIDVGAGSGRHAIEFAAWGLDVVAVDPSEEMVARARENAAASAERIASAGGSLRIVQGGFGELAPLGLGPVDAVTCTGNALPHVAGRDGLTEALADFSAVLNPRGLLVLHFLNHQRLLDKRLRSLPPKVVDAEDGTLVFLRVLNYPPGDGVLAIDFLALERESDGEWSVTGNRTEHTIITADTLRSELPCAGFARIEAFGGHDRHALTDADESVIVVATRD